MNERFIKLKINVINEPLFIEPLGYPIEEWPKRLQDGLDELNKRRQPEPPNGIRIDSIESVGADALAKSPYIWDVAGTLRHIEMHCREADAPH